VKAQQDELTAKLHERGARIKELEKRLLAAASPAPMWCQNCGSFVEEVA
jgi:hypothetical protein